MARFWLILVSPCYQELSWRPGPESARDNGHLRLTTLKAVRSLKVPDLCPEIWSPYVGDDLVVACLQETSCNWKSPAGRVNLTASPWRPQPLAPCFVSSRFVFQRRGQLDLQ